MKLSVKLLALALSVLLINLHTYDAFLRKSKKSLKSRDEIKTDKEEKEEGSSENTEELNAEVATVSGQPESRPEPPPKGADPDVSAADLAAAGTPGKDVPGYQSNPAPPISKVPLGGLELPKGYALVPKPPRVIPPEEEGYWESLFGQRRGEACAGKKMLRYELQKIGLNEDGSLGGKAGKGAFGWIKQWGFGQAAYFFDFLDPALRPLILDDFQKIWEKFSSYPSDDNGLYKDPFNPTRPLDPNLDPVSAKRYAEQMEKMKSVTETEVFKKSINAVQLNLGIRENRWYLDKSIADNAKSFIKKYDINGDGRLSPRELILGSIYNNKGILGNDDCQLCYEELTDKIDGIFAYIDCDGNGLINSEEIFKHLPKLRRDTTKWNYFTLASKATIRTAVTNDFILKNTYTLPGMLTKPEFRLGILLGFWDRQTDDNEIVKDERINMKALRWKDDDVVDIGAMDYIKYKAEAEAEYKARLNMAQQASKQPGIEITMATNEPNKD